MLSTVDQLMALKGTDKLATTALQSAYDKGYRDAKSAAVAIVERDAAEASDAKQDADNRFVWAVFIAMLSTTIGLAVGFTYVYVRGAPVFWAIGASAIGALVGIIVASAMLMIRR